MAKGKNTTRIRVDVAESARDVTLRTPLSLSVAVGRKDAILVRANPKLADLIPGFLRNRRQDVIAILEALDGGDFAIAESLGHGMKGAGGSWGFQAISDIGAAIEQAAQSVDNDASRKWVGELSRYLDRVEVVSD